jgi:predicted Zn-dependent protease
MRLSRISFLLATTLAIAACAESPTGRRQFIVTDQGQAQQIGAEAFREVLAEHPVSRDRGLNARVDTVARRIAAAAGMDPGACEVRVIEDDTPNAFALPGCKIGVHTGLFEVVENDAQLAAVLGHEMAHVTVRHAEERMSRDMLLNAALQLGGAVTGADANMVQLAATAATLGIVLPFTREQESEADAVGLRYMARAAYDPNEAVQVWKNFERRGDDRGPQFLSTHPSPGNRIAELEKLIPDVMDTYREARARR